MTREERLMAYRCALLSFGLSAETTEERAHAMLEAERPVEAAAPKSVEGFVRWIDGPFGERVLVVKHGEKVEVGLLWSVGPRWLVWAPGWGGADGTPEPFATHHEAKTELERTLSGRVLRQ